MSELPAEISRAPGSCRKEKRAFGERAHDRRARDRGDQSRPRGAVEAGEFREDLWYRLNVFPIEIPPLRERTSDIPILVEYFVARHGARIGKKIRRVEKKTMELFLAYPWPGNVRELQNVIERAAILTEGDTLEVEERSLRPSAGGTLPARSLPSSLQGEEKKMIESVLAETRGRVSGPGGAAVRLQIPSTTLESKIRKLNINKHRFRSMPSRPANR